MAKQTKKEELEDKLNHLYNRRSKAVEYKNYSDAEDYDYQIEDLEEELFNLVE